MKANNRLAQISQHFQPSMIKVSISDGVAIIELNPPTKLVFLSKPLGLELNDVLLTLEKDDTVKVIIITGRGNSFCTGASIKELETMNQKKFLF